MAEVRLDAMLASYVPKRRLSSGARSVRALLDDLEGRYPKLRLRLRDEAEVVRPFVKIFVNGREVRPREDGGPRLGPRDEVDILHSIQGG